MKIFFLYLFLIIITISNSSLLFKIKSTDPYCLGGEYNENSVLFLKYKIFTPQRKDLSLVTPYLTLYFQNVKTKQKLDSQHIFINKGKFTFKTKEAGLYDICILTHRYSVISDLKEDLFVNFKISPYYSDEESLINNPINTKDVNYVTQKVKQAISLTKPIIENQKNQLEDENEHSLKTLSNASFYKYLTLVQVIITIVIGLIQICNFRRFLKSQHVI